MGVSAGASDEGFRGGKRDRSWRRVDGSGNCFREFINNHVPWFALMTWDPNEDSRALPVVQSLVSIPGVMCAFSRNGLSDAGLTCAQWSS